MTDKFRAIERNLRGYAPGDVLEEFERHMKAFRERKAGLMPRLRIRESVPVPPSISYRAAVDLWRPELFRTRRERTAKEYCYALTGAEFRPWLDRPVRNIHRSDAAKVVAAIAQRGAERHAEVVAVTIRGLWRFLGHDARRAETGVDPEEMRGLRAPERTLVEDDDESEGLHVPDRKEIGAIMRWLSSADLLERDRLACRLLIYTVQRRRSVALARRADFKACGAAGGVWRIPPAHRKAASRAKRKGNLVGIHLVPLPPSAWTVVEEAMRIAGDSEWLFPAVRSRRADQPATTMSESTLTHIFSDMPTAASPHDMRRAFGTTYRLAAGLRKSDVGLLLDHGKRKSEDESTQKATRDHYAFDGGVDPEVWDLVRGWCDFVDAAAAERQDAEEVMEA
ncbi:hypothetical protein [Methylosinus sp. PW1]|uniref:tyrosine-type recombinase/integrase n=1 Tax=Methylosinus sp. PW1 TaxID=107636 RepID=UPI0012EC9885|nr:hypothetical protein [Methylosinus sp. PW1]